MPQQHLPCKVLGPKMKTRLYGRNKLRVTLKRANLIRRCIQAVREKNVHWFEVTTERAFAQPWWSRLQRRERRKIAVAKVHGCTPNPCKLPVNIYLKKRLAGKIIYKFKATQRRRSLSRNIQAFVDHRCSLSFRAEAWQVYDYKLVRSCFWVCPRLAHVPGTARHQLCTLSHEENMGGDIMSS